MDGGEQSYGLGCLVRLEPADGVKPDIRVARQQFWPFGERFLDAALAEVALAAGDQLLDLLGRAALADGDQLNVRRRAPSELGRRTNGVGNLLAAIGGTGHGAAMGGSRDAEKRWLELEGGADVDSLAVAAVVLQGGQAIAVEHLVADAAGQGDAARQRIGAADVERIIVAFAQPGERTTFGAVGAYRDPAGKAVERVTDADHRGLTAAERGIGTLDLRQIARNGKSPPANGQPEVIARGRQRGQSRSR